MKNIPGPRSYRPLGMFAEYRRNPFRFIIDNASKYGSIYAARFFMHETIFVNSPVLAWQLLVEHQKEFRKGDALLRNRDLLGDGLLTSDAETWTRERREAQPYFSSERLAKYSQIATRCANECVSRWKEGAISLYEEMVALTVQVVGEALLGSAISSQVNPKKLSNIFEAVLDYNVQYLTRSWSHIPGVRSQVTKRYREALAQCDSIADDIISFSLQGPSENTYLSSLLTRYRVGSISRKLVKDQIITSLFAGHETTALVGSYTLLMLAQNQDVQERLRAEEADRGNEAYRSMQEVPLLLASVIKETTRLYPPVWAIPRKTTSPCTVGDVVIPANTQVIIIPYVIHRDNNYYRSPAAFIPQRWTPEFERGLPKGAFLPFGIGPRMCIGAGFATLELAAIVSSVTRQFLLSPGEYRLELAPSLTLRPRSPITVVLSRRY
jgi:cytochrome P450